MLKTAIEEGIDVNETGVFYCLGNHDTDPSVLGDVMTEMPALFYSWAKNFSASIRRIPNPPRADGMPW